MISEEARKAGQRTRLPGFLAAQLCNEATSFLLFDPRQQERKGRQRIAEFNPSSGGTFRDWLARRLAWRARNLLFLWRSTSRPGDPTEPAAESASQVSMILAEVSEVLSSWSEEPIGMVDYFAVFATLIWLEIVPRVKENFDDETAPELTFPPFTFERAFKSGWPRLGAIWSAAQKRLTDPPYDLTADQFCELVRQMSPQADLNANTWYQWVGRAREEAAQRARARAR